EAALADQSDMRPDSAARAELRGGDSALFVYTSGTTGLPKAAKITHMRVRMTARASKFLADINDNDRVYNVLPLYHMTGGCMGTAGPLTFGATLVLRRRLSVSGFWDDVAEYGANKFVYIGELCRYLINAEDHPKQRAHQLELGFGNGLRGEVWKPFVERFGVGSMREFYGSTEGNVSFFNLDGTIGAIGQLPEWAGKRMGTAIVKFDVVEEKPVRGPDGFCVRAGVDEPGEVLGRIGTSSREDFGGYHDKKATEAKILTDVFEKGDRWFRTGDLIRRDASDYIYFIDRIGDTFRWKGENVATNEVSDVVSGYPGVELANVFGVEVPHAEGRAGMVAMTVSKDFDIDGLAAHLSQQLPPYAVPLFVRIQPEAETTGTFKFRKVDLVKEGFDLEQVSDPIWFLEPGSDSFVAFEPSHAERLEQGEYRL
ncbi:MAG: AMP-binding protein, partial [Pseudomonadota bacterium]